MRSIKATPDNKPSQEERETAKKLKGIVITVQELFGKIKLELAQFRELEAFAQFGSDLDARTKAQLDRGARIVELFKQSAFSPKPVPVMVTILWAMQNNFFADIDVDKVTKASEKLHEYLETTKDSLMNEITSTGNITDEIETGLKSALDDWKRGLNLD